LDKQVAALLNGDHLGGADLLGRVDKPKRVSPGGKPLVPDRGEAGIIVVDPDLSPLRNGDDGDNPLGRRRRGGRAGQGGGNQYQYGYRRRHKFAGAQQTNSAIAFHKTLLPKRFTGLENKDIG